MLIREHIECPLGTLTLLASDSGLVAVSIGEVSVEISRGRNGVLDAALGQLSEYFAGDRREFTVPLAAEGTDFQRKVWELLAEIPFSETRSYGELSEALEMKNGARAVGLANGQNPVAIIVPCHRVIGADGALTGYAGGLDAKRWLLEHEGALTPSLPGF